MIVTLIRACGGCTNCGSGKPTLCETPYNGDKGPLSTADGGVLHQAMACGAFAESVVVDQSQIVKIPDDMAKDGAALLSCGVITGVGAVVNAAGLRAGQDVVVIGAYAYLTETWMDALYTKGRLSIVDVEDPHHPVRLGWHDEDYCGFVRLAVAGDYACVVRPRIATAVVLSGNTVFSSHESDSSRCSASTPLNTLRRSVVGCRSRPW